jgi:hypothetical protein
MPQQGPLYPQIRLKLRRGFKRLCCTPQENEVCDVCLANVTRGFKGVDGVEIDTKFLRRQRVPDCRTFVDNDYAYCLEHFNDFTRAIAYCFDCFTLY